MGVVARNSLHQAGSFARIPPKLPHHARLLFLRVAEHNAAQLAISFGTDVGYLIREAVFFLQLPLVAQQQPLCFSAQQESAVHQRGEPSVRMNPNDDWLIVGVKGEERTATVPHFGVDGVRDRMLLGVDQTSFQVGPAWNYLSKAESLRIGLARIADKLHLLPSFQLKGTNPRIAAGPDRTLQSHQTQLVYGRPYAERLLPPHDLLGAVELPRPCAVGGGARSDRRVDSREEGDLGGGGVLRLVEQVVLAGEQQVGRHQEGSAVVDDGRLVAAVAPDRLQYAYGLIVLGREVGGLARFCVGLWLNRQ